MINFHLYLIKLWQQFFQMFVYGDVVMLKIRRYHMPVRPTLLFRKNLGNLREFFGQIVYRPPWQKIARTPMEGR